MAYRILLLGICLALGCRTTPPEEPERGGLISISGTPAAEPSVASAPTVTPLDMVEGDGELLLHLDLVKARESILYPLLKEGIIEEMGGPIEKARERCKLDLFDAIDLAAASAHSLEHEEALIVATINVPAETIMSCARKVFYRTVEVEVAGLKAVRADRLHVLAVEDLLLIGTRTEVKRALERRKARACTSGALRDVLGAKPDTPFALAVETPVEDIDSAHLAVSLRGQSVSAKGFIVFGDGIGSHWREYRKRSGKTTAQELEEKLGYELGKLEKVASKLFGENHELTRGVRSRTITRDGSRVSAQMMLPLTEAMKPALDEALALFHRDEQTSEAKNTIYAIARGAAAAYEREHVGPNGNAVHRLCKSAIDVPSSVPSGTEYQPSVAPGQDFDTGDPDTGWICLRFGLTQPHRYQYAYRQGGNYKGPARGGPDPGPNGYEISAEGDLDGDGKTSLFTLTGAVDPQTQRLRRTTSVYVVDELE